VDLTTTPPTDGDHLRYLDTGKKWIPEAPPTSVTEIGQLTDVSISAPAQYDGLYYQTGSATWESKPTPINYDNAVVNQTTPTDKIVTIDQPTQTIKIGTYRGTPSAGEFGVYLGDNAGLQHLSSAQNNFALGRAALVHRPGGVGSVQNFSGVRNISIGSRNYLNGNFNNTLALGTEVLSTGSGRWHIGRGIFRNVRGSGAAGSNVLRYNPTNGEIIYQLSCAAAKENIVPCTDADCEVLYSVPVRQFNYIGSDANEKLVGVISNEIEAAYGADVIITQPERYRASKGLVTYEADGDAYTDPETTPMPAELSLKLMCNGVDADRLTFMLLRLVQLQKAAIDALEARVTALEAV
jgi:hypothetical protein